MSAMALTSRIIPVFRTKSAGMRNFVQPAIRNYFGRRDMLSELSSTMQMMDRRIREMDREMCRFFDEAERHSPVRFPHFLSPWSWGRIREVPVEKTSEDGQKYRLELDIPDMRPEDINVSLKDHYLTIVGRREEKKEDGSSFVREYNYQCTLPKNINPESVRSLFSDGRLTIEAPLPVLEQPSEPREIPIKVDPSESKDNTSGKQN